MYDVNNSYIVSCASSYLHMHVVILVNEKYIPGNKIYEQIKSGIFYQVQREIRKFHFAFKMGTLL